MNKLNIFKTNPIIIIPAARTSIIQMINVADILQDLKYALFILFKIGKKLNYYKI